MNFGETAESLIYKKFNSYIDGVKFPRKFSDKRPNHQGILPEELENYLRSLAESI